jgi:hypothetical protein
LAGNLTGDTFSVTHSGGASDIAIATTPAFEEAHSLLNGPIASGFVETSGVFGASGSAPVNWAASLHPHS